MRRPIALAVAFLSAGACAPVWGPALGDAGPLDRADAAVLSNNGVTGHTGVPGAGLDATVPVVQVGTDPGPSKPATATAATIGGFGTAAEPRSAGALTVTDDGFETGTTLCAGQLCATGRFEP